MLAMLSWHSGESAHLPPMSVGFDFRTWHHFIWIEFVYSLLCAKRFLSGYSSCEHVIISVNLLFYLACASVHLCAGQNPAG